MSGKKTTRITIETHQIWLFQKGITIRHWCRVCSTEVDWIVPESVGRLASFPSAIVEKCIDLGLLHTMSTEQGSRLVCLNSVQQVVAKQERGQYERDSQDLNKSR